MANRDLLSAGFLATADLPRLFSSAPAGWSVDPAGGARTGSGAYAYTGAAQADVLIRVPMDDPSGDTVVLGWRSRLVGSTSPELSYNIAQFSYLGNIHLGVWRAGDGVVYLVRYFANGASSVLVTSALAPATGAAHYHKWATQIGASGRSRLWINDVLAFDFTGDTRGYSGSFGAPPLASLWTSYGFSGPPPGCTVYLQDIYANDGVVQDLTNADVDEWLDIQVNVGRPISDGTYEEWTASTPPDSFDMVNDTIPDDNTTRVESPATGSRDTFNMGAMEATGDTIKSTAVLWLAEKTTAGTALLAPMTYRAAAGTPTFVGDDTGPALNAYAYDGEILARDPHDSDAAWTEGNLLATEVGIKETTP